MNIPGESQVIDANEFFFLFSFVKPPKIFEGTDEGAETSDFIAFSFAPGQSMCQVEQRLHIVKLFSSGAADFPDWRHDRHS